MTKTQCARCHLAIHATSLAAAGIGAGLAQLPCSDSVAIVPIEIAMVIALGGVFSVRLNQISAEATLASATATLCGRGLSQALIGWIPGVGNACNAATAAFVVQLVGWAVVADFDKRTNSSAKGKEKEADRHGGHTKT